MLLPSLQVPAEDPHPSHASSYQHGAIKNAEQDHDGPADPVGLQEEDQGE